MTENVLNTDIVKILTSSSLTLMSVVVVILAHLLSQFEKARPLGEKARRPFYISSVAMMIILLTGATETILSLVYLLYLYQLETAAVWFNITLCLFTLLIGGIAAGGSFLTIKVLRKKGN